jgi:hypothetical protein
VNRVERRQAQRQAERLRKHPVVAVPARPPALEPWESWVESIPPPICPAHGVALVPDLDGGEEWGGYCGCDGESVYFVCHAVDDCFDGFVQAGRIVRRWPGCTLSDREHEGCDFGG